MDIKGLTKKQFKDKDFIFAVFDLLFIIVPGVLIIFAFERELFLVMDWVKLALLAAAVTAPVVFVNALLLGEIYENEIPHKDELFSLISASSMITAILLTISVIVAHLGRWNLTLFIGVLISVEVIIFLMALVSGISRNIRERMKKRGSK